MKGKYYKFIGFIKEGKRYLAHKDCHGCFGRGHLGRDIKRNTFLGCKCLKTTTLPINWVIL